MEYPRYSDSAAKCCKCGRLGYLRSIATLYLNKNEAFQAIGYNGDIIKRKCGGCGYVWYELPLDVNEGERKQNSDSNKGYKVCNIRR